MKLHFRYIKISDADTFIQFMAGLVAGIYPQTTASGGAK
jgi:hypothetical protein